MPSGEESLAPAPHQRRPRAINFLMPGIPGAYPAHRGRRTPGAYTTNPRGRWTAPRTGVLPGRNFCWCGDPPARPRSLLENLACQCDNHYLNASVFTATPLYVRINMCEVEMATDAQAAACLGFGLLVIWCCICSGATSLGSSRLSSSNISNYS